MSNTYVIIVDVDLDFITGFGPTFTLGEEFGGLERDSQETWILLHRPVVHRFWFLLQRRDGFLIGVIPSSSPAPIAESAVGNIRDPESPQQGYVDLGEPLANTVSSFLSRDRKE